MCESLFYQERLSPLVSREQPKSPPESPGSSLRFLRAGAGGRGAGSRLCHLSLPADVGFLSSNSGLHAGTCGWQAVTLSPDP